MVASLLHYMVKMCLDNKGVERRQLEKKNLAKICMEHYTVPGLKLGSGYRPIFLMEVKINSLPLLRGGE